MKIQQPNSPSGGEDVSNKPAMKPNLTPSTRSLKNHILKLVAAAGLAAACSATSLFAASQTWTNTPVSVQWTNVGNWVARAVPGAINQTGNTVSADIATFVNPVAPGGIGSAAQPIAPDDATIAADRSRCVLGVTFDSNSCGAYVIQSPSPAVFAAAGVPQTGILVVSHNGALRMNPACTNSQLFLIPMQVLLPSSTAGIFNLVNNSTNPAATLTISSITHGGATTRATTFILDGTNSGPNSITNLLEGGGNATGGFTKQGTGTWILNGVNDFKAASTININNGTLIVKNGGEFGNVTTTATVTSNAVLEIDGVNLGIATMLPRLAINGTIRMNGTAPLNGVVVSSAASTAPKLATTSASDVFTVNAVSGGLSGNTVLHTAGPGDIQLPAANTYVGNWSVDAGQLDELAVGALGTGANLNIAAGAVFSVTNLVASTYTLDTANLSASGTGTGVGSTAATIAADAAGIVDLATGSKGISLTITPTAFLGDLTHPALYISQGTLSLGGNAFSINNAGGSALGVGTYRLILQASGPITSGGGYSVVGVTGSGVVAGNVASIVVTGSEVDLVISPYVAKNLVWKGSASAWDIATTADWLNGAATTVFNNSDMVTFNSTGIANSSVTLASTLAPGYVAVDTAGGNYTLNGGQIAGTASLFKTSVGTLLLNEVNTYGGGTIVSNGTLQVGINNAISGTGAGDVAVQGAAVIDLNNNSISINGLNGSGTVDVVSGGGASTLSVGNNNNSGAFSGVLRNTTGTLALTKAGSGTQTFSGNNTYSGATTINLGSLKVTSLNALGSGNSPVTMAGGILDLGSSVLANSIAGSLGTIQNNSTSTTNTLIVQNGTSYGATIADGSGGGGVAVQVNTGTLILTAANSYSGGSIVAAGAGLLCGNVGSAGAGGIIASNGATVGLNNANNPSSFIANNLTTVDGATITVIGGGNQANNLAYQFYGSVLATNYMTGNCSIGGAYSFSNFLGTVIFSNTSARWFNANCGGDGATFDFEGGGVFSRDANTIRFGAMMGGTPTTGIGAPSVSFPATYIIGAKNLSTIFSGVINGSNNIVKTGSGSLTLNGVVITTNTDSATYTNYLYAPTINYLGNTTVSNGTLALVVPNSLSNSPVITLAGLTAVLDATHMGYVSNQLDDTFTVTNQVLVTNGVFELYAGQTLQTFGIGNNPNNIAGSVLGSFVQDAGATISMDPGTLAVSGAFTSSGTINMELNNTNAQTSDKITAGGAINLNGASLVVTNSGGDLVTGNVFTLFNKGVTGAFTLSLPAQNAAATITYVYQTNLVTAGSSPAGTIKVLVGASAVSTTPPTITNSLSGNSLTLTWPTDHIGWRLQVQTNSITTGLASNWVDVAGSTSVNTTTITVNPANGAVFYRMVYP